jgi:hypothetical protein
MKPEEKLLFETFIATHPEFLDIKTWTAGPEPPDITAIDSDARRIGIELTEWLDKQQTTPSIATEENQMRWLSALDSENHAPPRNFKYAQIWFRNGTRFSQREELSFSQEFYRLVAHVDENWEREMVGTHKIWNDFSDYPTLGTQVYHVRFEDRAPYTPSRWVLGTPRGGAYDPRQATAALLQRIEEKRSKRNYARLKSEQGLAEFVLLLHYGIRGIQHNWPFEGVDWKLEDSVREARTYLVNSPGPFDRVFLYLAFNEGKLFALYPVDNSAHP